MKMQKNDLWHPCTQMQWLTEQAPLRIRSAKGSWLYDSSGRHYLDAISSWWVNLFGHNHPKLNAAIQDQLAQFSHIMLAGLTHDPVETLSRELVSRHDGRLAHCFYASDGASAVEIALKMSFQYWQNQGQPQKIGFVSLNGGYHGETLGALGVTDVPLFRAVFNPLLNKAVHVPTPDWRHARAGESPQAFALRAAQELEDYLRDYHEITAGFILEPLVQGAAGMAMYHPAYLKRAREICATYEVHFIADEIAVGFGRTGTMFACEAAGITPDLLCLSKGITGGYLPLSVVMATDDIYQAFYSPELARGFLHSHSYSGNALACSAALAGLDIFKSENIIARNKDKQRYLNHISAALAAHPKVRDWRNTGMIWAFEVDSKHQEFARVFAALALGRNLLLRPLNNTVYFMPPYSISEEEMNFLVDGTLAIIEEI